LQRDKIGAEKLFRKLSELIWVRRVEDKLGQP
jgi:hypothetical protein